MGALTRRGFLPTLIAVGTVTVLTGIYLLWQLSGGFSGAFMGSRGGILLSSGGLAGIIALGVGFFVSRPTLQRMGAIMGRLAAAEGPPSDEDQVELNALRGRLRTAIQIAAVLLLIAVATMALGPHI